MFNGQKRIHAFFTDQQFILNINQLYAFECWPLCEAFDSEMKTDDKKILKNYKQLKWLVNVVCTVYTVQLFISIADCGFVNQWKP